MTDPVTPPSERPAHYRLSTETWELILKEYREGATARALARAWRVSEHAVRRRITRHRSTKREWGDRQAIAGAVAREAELEQARANTPEAKAARLFTADPDEDAAAGDPGELARTAVLASGRAMRGQLWTEARTLAGLAEVYTRLAGRQAAAAAGAANAGEDESALDAAAEDRLRDDLLQRILALNAELEADERAAAATAADGGDMED